MSSASMLPCPSPARSSAGKRIPRLGPKTRRILDGLRAHEGGEVRPPLLLGFEHAVEEPRQILLIRRRTPVGVAPPGESLTLPPCSGAQCGIVDVPECAENFGTESRIPRATLTFKVENRLRQISQITPLRPAFPRVSSPEVYKFSGFHHWLYTSLDLRWRVVQDPCTSLSFPGSNMYKTLRNCTEPNQRSDRVVQDPCTSLSFPS